MALALPYAHLLTPRQRRYLLGRPASFVLTTYHDLSAEVVRRGLESVVPRPSEGLSRDRLVDLFTRRGEAARRGSSSLPRLPLATVDDLLLRFGADVRSVEQALYGSIVRHEECGDVQL